VPLVDDCRGLILSKDYKNVLCRPFTRFYNYGQGDINKNFNFKDAVVFTKEDGSLMPVYFDGTKICVSSRSMAFAEGTSTCGKTFKQLFLEAGGFTSEEEFQDVFTAALLKNYKVPVTFIFECVGPENRIVKRYENPELVLLCVRENESGIERNLKDALKALNKTRVIARLPQTFDLNDYESIVKSFDSLGALDEGYVCFDPKTCQRVKLKSPAYLAAHHIRGENGVVSPKRMVALIALNDHEEYLLLFDTDRKYFEPYIAAYEKLIVEIEQVFSEYKGIESQKDFALAIKDRAYSSVLFKKRAQPDASVRDLLNNLSDDSKLSLVEKFKV
jgi:hypothetical protein